MDILPSSYYGMSATGAGVAALTEPDIHTAAVEEVGAGQRAQLFALLELFQAHLALHNLPALRAPTPFVEALDSRLVRLGPRRLILWGQRFLQQQIEDRGAGYLEGREAVPSASCHVGTMLQQEAHCLKVSELGSLVKGRPAARRLDVHKRGVCQHKLPHLTKPVVLGCVQESMLLCHRRPGGPMGLLCSRGLFLGLLLLGS